MKIGIIGAGAIGGLMAYRLAAAGHKVSCVARGATLAALRRRGIGLVDGQASGPAVAEASFQAVRASDESAELGPRTWSSSRSRRLPWRQWPPALGPSLAPRRPSSPR